jgi:hypothetical protein
METVKQLLDYCATQEEAIITYLASKMILNVHSDAGYLHEKKARSQASGHFFLSNNDTSPPNNGAFLTNATIIKAVMSSAAEAELGALYLNAKEAAYLCQILQEMGHPQPRTPIQTNNTTAEGVINNKIRPKCTKAMDEIPLATQPRSTETNQNYLEAGEDKLGGLLHKTLPTCSPCQC